MAVNYVRFEGQAIQDIWRGLAGALLDSGALKLAPYPIARALDDSERRIVERRRRTERTVDFFTDSSANMRIDASLRQARSKLPSY